MLKKMLVLIGMLSVALTVASCSADVGRENIANTSNVNRGNVNTSAQGVVPGNSEIRTETVGGVETQTRTFNDANSPVERVVVTRRDGRRTARIHLRSGDVREVTTEGDIERALNSTGDTLVSLGSEVADKAEDVGDKAADAGREVGDKAEDVGDKAVSGAKKAGSATKKGVKKAGDKIEDIIP